MLTLTWAGSHNGLIEDTVLGIPATYWRIISAQVDFGTDNLMVFVAGYANQQAREDGKAPLEQVQVNFTANDFVPDQPRASLYAALKDKPEFSGAQDA